MQLIQTDVTQICTSVYEFLKNMLNRQETQHDVLMWLGLFMNWNQGRGKVNN